MKKVSQKQALQALLRSLKSHYKAAGRAHLPWRATHDPYRVLVSEIMLQQTQVDRVIPFYKNFLKKFPTVKALAKAPLGEVLLAWQGLGYNRRGRFLHEAGKILAKEGWSDKKLPGVGPYTAAAVKAFANNQPTVFIETNIRTVFFYHMPKISRTVLGDTKVSDAELLPLVEEALKRSKMAPRDFYAALMDYGSHLKKQGVKLNQKSKHYAKQSKFEGSRRQKRAAALRELLKKGASEKEIEKLLDSR